MKPVVIAFAFALLATPAFAAGELPDGTYDCAMDDGIGNGSMVIAGNTYQGPNYDDQYDGTYTFEVSPDGNIDFQGPVGMYSDPSMQFVGGLVIYPDKKTPAIELHVKLKGSDTVHFVQCDIRP